jgi:hypothetical protein
MRQKLDIRMQDDVRPNMAEGTDLDALTDNSTVFDGGHRMNAGAFGDSAHA